MASRTLRDYPKFNELLIVIENIKISLNRAINAKDFFGDKPFIDSPRIFICSFCYMDFNSYIALTSCIPIFEPFIEIIFRIESCKNISPVIKE